MTDVGILAGPEGPGDRSKKWGPKIPTFWVSRVPRGRPDPQNQSFPPPGKVLFYYFRACCCAALLALLGVMAPGAHAAVGSEPRRHRRLGAGRVEAAAHRRDPARARLWPLSRLHIFDNRGAPPPQQIHPPRREVRFRPKITFLILHFWGGSLGGPFLILHFWGSSLGGGPASMDVSAAGRGLPDLKKTQH